MRPVKSASKPLSSSTRRVLSSAAAPNRFASLLYATWAVLLVVCIFVWTAAQSTVLLRASHHTSALLVGRQQLQEQEQGQQPTTHLGMIVTAKLSVSPNSSSVVDCGHRPQQQQQQQQQQPGNSPVQQQAPQPLVTRQDQPTHLSELATTPEQLSQYDTKVPLQPQQAQQASRQPPAGRPAQPDLQRQAGQVPPPPPQQQQQQQQQPNMPAYDPGPVDVVYLWVDGNDPLLHRELAQWQQQTQTVVGDKLSKKTVLNSSAGPQAVVGDDGVSPPSGSEPTLWFHADREELRFSIRSLEQYLPWYRHLYIVTNGQVPVWMSFDHPRATIVPHSTIFANASDLPTFNQNAVLANLLNIPGLSDFILMEEPGIFLAAPWSVGDFIRPDGSLVLTGSRLVRGMRADSARARMLINLDAEFTARFGHWDRFDPHPPSIRLIEQRWLRELYSKTADLFRRTSAAHIRSPTDLLLGPAYDWFVAQFHPGHHVRAPSNRAKLVNLSDKVANTLMLAALQDLQDRAATGDGDSVAANMSLPASGDGQGGQLARARAAATFEVARSVIYGLPGRYVASKSHAYVYVLIEAWTSMDAKVITITDDLTRDSASALGLLNPVVNGFLVARYSRPHQVEMPSTHSNVCGGRLKTKFGELPALAHFSAVCNHTQKEPL